MIFDVKEEMIIKEGKFKKIQYDDYNVYYCGLIFEKDGVRVGKESIDIIIEEYEKGKIEFQNIYGTYQMIIKNKKENEWILFTDNSNMTTLFYNDYYISDDFLDMIKRTKNPQMNNKIVCEYLSLLRGFYFETFVKNIKMFRNLYYYKIKNGKIEEASKQVGYLGEKSSVKDITSFFTDMARSLNGLKIVSALTGGYDSRMVAACLNDKLQFDFFISGNNEEADEIKISKLVAKKLNKKWKLIKPDMKVVNKTEVLEKTFFTSGGRSCYNTSGIYRVNYFMDVLANEKYEVLLTGDAGDMYKDFWDKQDYPFYYRKRTNLNLFYSFRMEANDNCVFLGDKLRSYYKKQKSDIIENMKEYKFPRAVRSYESFGYIVDWRKNVFAGNINENLITYAPLQEIELIKYAFTQPIKKRYLNLLQREIILENAPQIAEIITTNGTTAALNRECVLKDIWNENMGQIKRICRGLKRKIYEKEKSMAKVMIEDDSDLRELKISRNALEYCQNVGYINSKVKIQDIPITVLYKIIYLYQLSQIVNK